MGATAASDGYSASKIANCLNGTRFVLCTNIDTRPSRVACVEGGRGGKLSFEGQAKNRRRLVAFRGNGFSRNLFRLLEDLERI